MVSIQKNLKLLYLSVLWREWIQMFYEGNYFFFFFFTFRKLFPFFPFSYFRSYSQRVYLNLRVYAARHYVQSQWEKGKEKKIKTKNEDENVNGEEEFTWYVQYAHALQFQIQVYVCVAHDACVKFHMLKICITKLNISYQHFYSY